MNKAIASSTMFFLLFLAILPAEAVTFFVDFESGNDSNDGQSKGTAWKHAPGDQLATGNPAGSILQPGDRVLFKGGVTYRGSIDIPASGSQEAPIIYAGNLWDTEKKAIIDGGDILTGWQPCESAAACGDNQHWQNIFYTTLPGTTDAFVANLHETNSSTAEEEFLWIAQNPNPGDPYFYDNRDDFTVISQDNLTRTTITDPAHFNQADSSYWAESYIQVWVNPNRVTIRQIKGYDPAQNQITFDDLGQYALYPDGRDQSYCIYNSIHALDYPGEFTINASLETGGLRKIFLWPYDGINLNQRITYSVREYGFNIGANSYVTIEGFEIRKHSADTIRRGGGVATISNSSADKFGVIVKNNLITHNRQVSNSYGGIYLSNCSDSVVESNIIVDNPKHKGIFCAGVDNTIIKNNEIIRPGSTSLSFYTSKKSQIIGNTIKESRGSHANGITLYMGCRDILVADNTVLDSSTPLTFEDSGNLYFINNIFDGSNGDNNTNEWGDTSHGPWERGTIAFFNNTMLRNSRDSSLNIGANDGIVTESQFRSIIAEEAARLRLLTNLFDNGYISSGTILNKFKELTLFSQLVLESEFDTHKEAIFAILQEEQAQNRYISLNNLLDGGSTTIKIFNEQTQQYQYIFNPHYLSDYNLYTGLSWMQSLKYGWVPAPHDIVTFLDREDEICTSPETENFELIENSPAIDAGIDPGPYLKEVSALFPDYDFSRDKNGVQRPQGAAWDMGAFEYCSGACIERANGLFWPMFVPALKQKK